MFWNTFLSILGVIGIIVVATFVIVFLSDLFISIIDGSNGIFFKRNKNKVESQQEDNGYYERPKMLEEPVKQIEQKTVVEHKFEESKQEVREEKDEQEDVDFNKAEEEERLARQNIQQESRIVEPTNQVEEDIKEEVEPVKPQIVEEVEEQNGMENFIPVITQETLQELERLEKFQEEKNQIIAQQQQESLERIEKLQEENDQIIAQQKQESLEREQELQNQIEELKRQIEQDQATIKSLEEESAKAQEVKSTAVTSQTREELENRLEVLKQRLKENEKELSANRKEFAPLKRVNMTLDSDKRKLRRKEAIVAKQKVVLYGVNNYVDIDEEKAKKLSEELDLLEGLRLSVQHCEEVMQKNKDRYPILERANQFLVKSQSQLKSDIADIENKLALLDASESDNNSDSDDTTSE